MHKILRERGVWIVLNAQETAELILKLCKERGISVNKAVLESGAGKSLIDRMKIGNEPSAKKLKLIADYFGVSTDYLLTGKECIKEDTNMEEMIKFYLAPINVKLAALRKESGMSFIEIQNELRAINPGFSYTEHNESEEHWLKIKNVAGIDLSGADRDIKGFEHEGYIADWLEAVKNIFKYDYLLFGINPNIQCEPNIQKNAISIFICKKIDDFKEQKGWSYGRIAKEIGLDEISIISWMTGERKPSDHHIRLLNALCDDEKDWIANCVKFREDAMEREREKKQTVQN